MERGGRWGERGRSTIAGASGSPKERQASRRAGLLQWLQHRSQATHRRASEERQGRGAALVIGEGSRTFGRDRKHFGTLACLRLSFVFRPPPRAQKCACACPSSSSSPLPTQTTHLTYTLSTPIHQRMSAMPGALISGSRTSSQPHSLPANHHHGQSR